MKINAMRQTVGFTLAAIFLLLIALMVFLALNAFGGFLPGYPIFFLSCLGLVVCSFRLAIGATYGVISVQCLAVVGMIGVFLDGRNYQDKAYFLVFLPPLIAALIGAQVIKVRTHKIELNDGETA